MTLLPDFWIKHVITPSAEKHIKLYAMMNEMKAENNDDDEIIAAVTNDYDNLLHLLILFPGQILTPLHRNFQSQSTSCQTHNNLKSISERIHLDS